MATAGGKNYSEMFVNRSNSASKDNNKLIMGESAIDLNASGSEDKSGSGVPILRFPKDIAEPHKKYRSIDFYILKDIAYQGVLEKLKESAKNVKNAAGNVVAEATKKGGDVVKAGKDLAAKTVEGIKNITAATYKAVDMATLTPDNCESKDFHAVISLPIPNILTEEDNHSYDENNIETPEEVTGAFTKMIGAVGKYGDSLVQIGQQLVNPNRRHSRSLRQLPVLNPFTWKKYKGSAMKEFRFTFFLVPRNAEEAEQVMRIVYTLKKYSYGSKNNTEASKILNNDTLSEFFISAPPKVLMKFPNNLVNKMVNPGVCVISSISATYQEGNTVGMTADGVPRFIELTIALLEFNQRFQEDFEAVK